MNVPPSKKAHLTIATQEADIFTAGIPFLKRLGYASQVTVTGPAGLGSDKEEAAKGVVTVITHAARIGMPLAELVDLEKEKARIAKELKKNRGELEKLSNKLNNPGFLAKAPEQVVAAEKERAEKLTALIAQLEAQEALPVSKVLSLLPPYAAPPVLNGRGCMVFHCLYIGNPRTRIVSEMKQQLFGHPDGHVPAKEGKQIFPIFRIPARTCQPLNVPAHPAHWSLCPFRHHGVDGFANLDSVQLLVLVKEQFRHSVHRIGHVLCTLVGHTKNRIHDFL